MEGEKRTEKEEKAKNSLSIPSEARQVLLTFNSVCATYCRGQDANEEELKVARGLSLMDCSLAVFTLGSVHQK